jgi:hypothetical protein
LRAVSHPPWSLGRRARVPTCRERLGCQTVMSIWWEFGGQIAVVDSGGSRHVDTPPDPRTPNPLGGMSQGTPLARCLKRLSQFEVLQVFQRGRVQGRWRPRGHPNTPHRYRLPVPPGAADLAPDPGGSPGEVCIAGCHRDTRGIKRATVPLTSCLHAPPQGCQSLIATPPNAYTPAFSWQPPPRERYGLGYARGPHVWHRGGLRASRSQPNRANTPTTACQGHQNEHNRRCECRARARHSHMVHINLPEGRGSLV